jgi:hypothetical protein
MHDILIAIGTNVIADRIWFVEECLEQRFENVRFTQIIPTEPIGERFKGKQFCSKSTSAAAFALRPDANIINIDNIFFFIYFYFFTSKASALTSKKKHLA